MISKKSIRSREKLEAEQIILTQQMAENGFYQQLPEVVAKITEKYQKITNDIATLYARWEELDS